MFFSVLSVSTSLFFFTPVYYFFPPCWVFFFFLSNVLAFLLPGAVHGAALAVKIKSGGGPVDFPVLGDNLRGGAAEFVIKCCSGMAGCFWIVIKSSSGRSDFFLCVSRRALSLLCTGLSHMSLLQRWRLSWALTEQQNFKHALRHKPQSLKSLFTNMYHIFWSISHTGVWVTRSKNV